MQQVSRYQIHPHTICMINFRYRGLAQTRVQYFHTLLDAHNECRRHNKN